MLHKGLSAEAGLHRHDQHHVQLLDVGQHGVGAGDGPQSDRLFDLALVHDAQGFGDAGGVVGFQMDAEQVGARFGKCLDIAHRLVDHQMHVQKHIGFLADGLHHGHADGDVGHESAVHDIHVYPVGGADGLNVAFQIAEVSRKNGGGDFDHNSCPPVLLRSGAAPGRGRSHKIQYAVGSPDHFPRRSPKPTMARPGRALSGGTAPLSDSHSVDGTVRPPGGKIV